MTLLKRKQQGYILMEILIGVIVVLGLTIWWVTQKNIDNQNQVAQLMTQQINEIRSASINMYEASSQGQDWPPKSIKITILITNHFLPASEDVNPFGEAYQINIDATKKVLVITTSVPTADLRVAQKAIEPIADAHVDTSTARIRVEIPAPIFGANDPTAVHYVDIVKSGDYVDKSKANCGEGYTPQIYTAISSCRSSYSSYGPMSLPIESCNTYATDKNDPKTHQPAWLVDSSVLTPDGWIYQVPSGKGTSYIQVTLRCKKQKKT